MFSLPGGVPVDRFLKRAVLLWTQGSGLLQAVILWLLVVTSLIQPWHLMVLAICWGMTNSLDVPARQSIVIELVGRSDLPNAVTLNSSQFSMARAIGPALAGLQVDWSGGVAPIFLLNALSFVPVFVGLALMETSALQAEAVSRQKETRNLGLWKSVQEGLVYTARTPAVLLIMIVIGLVSLFGINFNVVLPLFATDVLHTGATGFGLLTGAFGLGAFLSGVFQAWGNKRASLSSLLGSALIFCLVEAVFALSRWYVLSLVLITAVGFLQILFFRHGQHYAANRGPSSSARTSDGTLCARLCGHDSFGKSGNRSSGNRVWRVLCFAYGSALRRDRERLPDGSGAPQPRRASRRLRLLMYALHPDLGQRGDVSLCRLLEHAFSMYRGRPQGPHSALTTPLQQTDQRAINNRFHKDPFLQGKRQFG